MPDFIPKYVLGEIITIEDHIRSRDAYPTPKHIRAVWDAIRIMYFSPNIEGSFETRHLLEEVAEFLEMFIDEEET